MKHDRGEELARRILVGTGAVIVLCSLGWGIAVGDAVSSIVMALVGCVPLLIAFILGADGTGGRLTDEMVEQIRKQSLAYCADRAGAVPGTAGSSGPTTDSDVPECGRSGFSGGAGRHAGVTTVDANTFAGDWATAFANFKSSRILIHGCGGSGKSTLSLLAAHRLLERQELVPLVIPLGGWQAGRQSFADWLDRALVHAFTPVTALTAQNRARRVLSDTRFVLILDGFDELSGQPEQAATEILREIPGECRLIVLSRHQEAQLLRRDTRFLSYQLDPPSTDQVAAHFAEGPDLLLPRDFRQALDNRDAGLFALLRTPLHINLVRTALEKGWIPADDLLQRLADGRPVLDDLILNHIADDIDRSSYLRTHEAGSYLHRLAVVTARSDGGSSFDWWRVADLTPPTVYGVVLALIAFPAYLLATIMPQGLTRGFAIGVMTAVYIGVLRARPLGVIGILANLVTVFAVVIALGAFRYDWPQATVDAVQISTATVGGLLIRRILLKHHDRERKTPPWIQMAPAAGLLVAISALCSAFTVATAKLTGFDDTRGFLAIAVAVLLGLSVATVSSRLLLPADHDLQPTLVQLNAGARKGPVYQYYAAGLLSAVAIGACGGFVGALTVGPKYGMALAIWFGLVAGIPIGLVGGFVNHRTAAPLSPELRAVTATPSTDRAVALGIVVGISVTSGLFIMIGEATLGDRIDRVSHLAVMPVHGILFGLTIGLIVAGFKTAWPSFAIGHAWLAGWRVLPWPLEVFLHKLWQAEILVMDGNAYAFRHLEYQQALVRAQPEWADSYLLVRSSSSSATTS